MKHLETINRKYQIIKMLDKQIIGIEKLALQLTNSENIIYFNLNIESLNHKEEEQKAFGMSDLLEMHSSIMGFTSGGPFGVFNERKSKADDNRLKLDTKTTLLVLGMIVQSFNQKREQLVTEIEELMTA